MKIGVIDWGIGGLGVYKELKKEMKSISVVYFSDSGFTPYGKTPLKKLVARLNRITKIFRHQNISTVVIACNAASTVLGQLQKRNPDIKYYGMLTAGEKMIRKNRFKSVVVLGGKRTIESRFFQKAFKNSQTQVQAMIAQPLSALIEKGQQNSEIFARQVEKLANIAKSPQAVLLACTHYPAATNVFKKKFKNALILDPAQFVVKELKNKIKPGKTKARSAFYTTGSVDQSQRAAYKAFGLKISTFQKVKFN